MRQLIAAMALLGKKIGRIPNNDAFSKINRRMNQNARVLAPTNTTATTRAGYIESRSMNHFGVDNLIAA